MSDNNVDLSLLIDLAILGAIVGSAIRSAGDRIARAIEKNTVQLKRAANGDGTLHPKDVSS